MRPWERQNCETQKSNHACQLNRYEVTREASLHFVVFKNTQPIVKDMMTAAEYIVSKQVTTYLFLFQIAHVLMTRTAAGHVSIFSVMTAAALTFCKDDTANHHHCPSNQPGGAETIHDDLLPEDKVKRCLHVSGVSDGLS